MVTESRDRGSIPSQLPLCLQESGADGRGIQVRQTEYAQNLSQLARR